MQLQVVAELQKRQMHKQESMPLLDGEADLQITDKAYRKGRKALRQLEKQFASHALSEASDLAERLSALQRKHVSCPPRLACSRMSFIAALIHRRSLSRWPDP